MRTDGRRGKRNAITCLRGVEGNGSKVVVIRRHGGGRATPAYFQAACGKEQVTCTVDTITSDDASQKASRPGRGDMAEAEPQRAARGRVQAQGKSGRVGQGRAGDGAMAGQKRVDGSAAGAGRHRESGRGTGR